MVPLDQLVRRLTLHGIAVALVSACGSNTTNVGDGSPPTFGLEQRVVVSGLQFPTALPQPTPLQTVQAFPNISFSQPVFITHAGDASDRLFVVEKTGTIRVFTNDAAVTSTSVFLNISAQVLSDGEQGLLGLAFDPEYATNGFFYVYYSVGSPRRSRISRFRVSAGDPNQANPASETILLHVDQPTDFSNHKAGMIAFGPDGKLYIATGDGGSGDDPFNNSQNLNSLLGKILRIDTDGGIPGDNPFVGQAGARGEIWAYGLRNPFRMSFDRGSGRLWAGDVGQNRREEIDIIVRGGNYGWRIYEGTLSHINPSNLPASNFVAPVLDYGRALGFSVTGGYVYRGAALAGFNGAYFYGDFGSGRIWALVHDGNTLISNTEVASLTSNPSSFGEDEAGELFVVGFSDGRIYRFQPTQPPGATSVPTLLSQTGVFTNLADLAPTPGLVEYDVNSPLWSDSAAKRRWIALPGTSRIDFDAQDNWSFPVGTVLVKHFELPRVGGGMQRLETRVLVHQVSGWQGYTYRWNAAATDATLLASAESGDYTVPDGGASRDVTWYFPSQADCRTCHTAAAGHVLGIRTNQLNRDFAYPARGDNQLRAWNHIGLFDIEIGNHTQYTALARPDDTGAPLAARSRAYLEANCANCHRAGGPTPVSMDLRASIPIANAGIVNVPASTPVDGIAGALRLTPGSRLASDLWLRLSRRDQFGMPPLATNQVDAGAVDLIGNWIDTGSF